MISECNKLAQKKSKTNHNLQGMMIGHEITIWTYQQMV